MAKGLKKGLAGEQRGKGKVCKHGESVDVRCPACDALTNSLSNADLRMGQIPQRTGEIPEPYKSAHTESFKNRSEVIKQHKCSCFACGQSFPTKRISHWTDHGQTPLCPFCGIDAVLPGERDAEFLGEMRRWWL